MDRIFYNEIAQSTAYRKSREYIRDWVIASPELFSSLTEIAFNIKDKHHHKACWVLELLCEEDIKLLYSHLNTFCETIAHFQINGAIRSASKICFLISQAKNLKLTDQQENQLTETCLDWLIQDKKVAVKAYAMRALYNFGKKHPWIHSELQHILIKDFNRHSSGYKVAAKEILQKIIP